MPLVQFFKNHKSLMPLLAAAIFLIIFSGATFYSVPAMWWSFRFLSYYLMWGLFLFWGWTAVKAFGSERERILSKFKESRFDLLGLFILCLILFLVVKPEFRIEADESALSLVSYTLLKEKAAHLIGNAFWSLGDFLTVEYSFPIRPLTFPFFLQIIHTFLGYKPYHAFVLNFFAGFFLLSFLFVISRSLLTRMKAWALIVALFSFPIFNLCFTSAGFDLLHVCFFVLLAFANYNYLKKKNSEALLFLWSTFLLYAQTRYEAIVIGFFFFLPFLVKRKYSFRLIKENLSILLVSFVGLFPFLWQTSIRVLKLPNYLGFEDMMNMPSQGAFSFESLLMNFLSVVKAIFLFNFYLPLNNILIVLSLVAIGYIFYRDLKRKPLLSESLTDDGQLSIAGIIFASLVHFLFILSFVLGMINLPQNSRLFLPEVFLVLFILAIILLKIKIPEKLLLGFALLNFVLFFPVTTNSAFHKDIPHDRSKRMVYNFIEKNKLSREFVIVTSHPAIYTSHQYGALNFDLVQRYPSYISDKLLKSGLIKHVYVLQDYPLEGTEPISGYEIPANSGLELIPLEEALITDGRKSRISELVLKK